MAKKIPLTKGFFAVVDDEDYPAVSNFKWRSHLRRRRDAQITCVYAVRWQSHFETQGRRVMIYMHRQILGLPPARKPEVDHIDSDGLNNRRSNLRLATASQQHANERLQINNTSSRKGVRRNCTNRKWIARITVNGKEIHLGSFATLDEASAAHDAAARQHFGEYFKPSTSVFIGD